MPLHSADVDLTSLWNQVNGVAGAPPAVFGGDPVFNAGIDLRGNIVDGAQASGTVGVPIALANVGSVTAETIGLQQAAQTLTITGGYTTQRFVNFAQPTISAATSQTVTNAATVAIANAPLAGGSATITNPYALWVQAGNAFMGGRLLVGGPGTAGFQNPTGGIIVEDASQPGIRFQRTGQIAYEWYIGSDNRWKWPALGVDLSFNDQGSVTAETTGLKQAGNTLTITGGYSTQREVLFQPQTITAASSLTVTNAATLAVSAAPSAAGSAVITNAYGAWVQAGNTRLDGGLTIGGNPPGIANTIGIGNSTGVGNGIATAVLAPAKSTGSGPASLTASTWIQVWNGTTQGWIPFFV